jgi:hypothetical protein
VPINGGGHPEIWEKTMTDTNTIRSLNDRFRQGDSTQRGQIVITRGLVELMEDATIPPEDLAEIVRSYDSFTPDADPHGEHDFGVFEFAGERCFWKLDYYSPDLKSGSEDPTDIEKTTRVLTIMLASEY